MAMSNGSTKMENNSQKYEFVGKIPDELICKICKTVLSEPRQVVCCGQHYCKGCIERKITVNYVCPSCQTHSFNHFRDVHFEQRIIGLKVHCPHHKRGCKWTGELGMLKGHLQSAQGCAYESMSCPNKCGEKMQRKDVKEHLTKHCNLRRVRCQYCNHENSYQQIMLNHYSVCANYPVKCTYNCGQKSIRRADLQKHEQQCPMKPVLCPFQSAGCKVKLVQKDFQEHLSTYTQQHLDMVTKSFDTLRTRAEVAEKELKSAKSEVDDFRRRDEYGKRMVEKKLQAIGKTADELLKTCTESQRFAVQTIRSLTDDTFHLRNIGQPIVFQMINYSEFKRSGKVWYSPPFYVASGYKMCLAIYAAGMGMGLGSSVSISLCLMSGEFDDELQWPVELPFHLAIEMLRSEQLGGEGANTPPTPKTYMYFHADTPQGQLTDGMLHESRKCETFARHDVVEEWMLFYDAITLQISAESEFL